MLIVDFAPHGLEQLREEQAHRRLGFDDAEMKHWCQAAGLERVDMTRFDNAARIGNAALSVCLWNAVKPERGRD